MQFLSTIFILIATANGWMTGLSDSLYEQLNGLAGRSWIFDNLIDLPLESNLVKAGVIGACFLYAWLASGDEAEIARRRRILLVTILASVFVVATTKTLSKMIFLPRPFIQSQKTFHLDGDRLIETARLDYRVPLDEENQKSFNALQRGEIVQNDLGSFPSDHAGFYMTLAVGVLLACRFAGSIALLWTLFVTLGSRVITGQHSPLDIAAGALIGIGILIIAQLLVGRAGGRLITPVVNWTLRYSALSSAVIFIFLFEAVNKLEDVSRLLKVGKDVVKHLIRG